jgi:hypothetical protein
VACTRCKGARKVEEPDHDENDWPSVAEVEKAAAHFLQQKKYADGNHHDGTHEAARGTALACATNPVAHLSQTSL